MRYPFFLFMAPDNGSGAGDGNGGTQGEQGAENKTEAEPAKTTEKETDPDVDKLVRQNAELQAKLKKYQEKEEEERKKNLTAEQRAKELEAENARFKREILIEKVRRTYGFADKVFDVVSPAGETEEDIKSAFEQHKAALEEYMKAHGKKAGQGGGTDTTTTPGKGTAKPKENRPWLVQIGLVPDKKQSV